MRFYLQVYKGNPPGALRLRGNFLYAAGKSGPGPALALCALPAARPPFARPRLFGRRCFVQGDRAAARGPLRRFSPPPGGRGSGGARPIGPAASAFLTGSLCPNAPCRPFSQEFAKKFRPYASVFRVISGKGKSESHFPKKFRYSSKERAFFSVYLLIEKIAVCPYN